jgi:hypothetical protein
LDGKKWLQNSALFALKGTVITTARTGPPLRPGARTSGCALQSVLQKIIIELSKFLFLRNPFDCVSLHAVRSGRWPRIVAMLEAITAFFFVISAGIFIAHALDGYRSSL